MSPVDPIEVGQWHFSETHAFGATRNPWQLEHTPGGSSGGAAAAVAAGLVAGAMGSDGAGSIRIPAAWTNLVGLKPQRGRVFTWPDAEAFNGLSCYGGRWRATSPTPRSCSTSSRATCRGTAITCRRPPSHSHWRAPVHPSRSASPSPS